MRLKTKFQDEDFELGEVVDAKISDLACDEDDKRFKITASAKKGGRHTFFYSSIAEFLEKWEDAPEPNMYYFIGIHGQVKETEDLGFDWQNKMVEIGNRFGSEEEAKQAVEKLKAWKRLKDRGFRFGGYGLVDGTIRFMIDLRPFTPDDLLPDLDLLFSQEVKNEVNK